MRVLVTGARGGVGKAVVDDLVARGHDVRATDRHAPDLLAAEPFEYVQADLTSAGDAFALVHDLDAVIHAAALPVPFRQPDHTVFGNNVSACFNVVTAAARAGVGRFVFISSETVHGLSFAARLEAPLYLPVDEAHPLRPQDPYALSKLCGEEIVAAATRTGTLTAVSLRLSWVHHDADYAIWDRADIAAARRGPGSLWGYIDAADAVDAIRLALTAPVSGHEAVYIVAPENTQDEPLAALAAEIYPGVPVRESGRPDGPGLSGAKAERLLGFRAARHWRERLTP